MNKQQIKALLAIKSIDEVKKFSIISRYFDDHLPCADVKVNGIKVQLLWHDDLGFLDYYDESPRAARKLLQAIRTGVFMELQNMQEDEDAEFDAELQQLFEELEKECY